MTKPNWKLNSQNNEKGQSLVELGLLFTTLVLMLGILVDVGRAFFTLIALHDAAQEGAIHSSMNPTYNESSYESTWPKTKTAIITSSNAPINFQAAYDAGTFRIVHPTINGCTHHDSGCPTTNDCSGFDYYGNANTTNVTVLYDFEFIMPLITNLVPGGMLTLSATADSTIVYPPCN